MMNIYTKQGGYIFVQVTKSPYRREAYNLHQKVKQQTPI